MQAIITTAGFQALVASDNTGTNAVTITEVGVGSGTTPATPDRTTLANEVKRLSVAGGGVSGQAVDAQTIHTVLRDESGDAYAMHEFGLYLADGTLFALYAQTGVIFDKASATTLLLSIDIRVQGADVTSVTFGDVSFSNPPWSETVVGVLKRATQGLAEAMTDNVTGMTPLRTAQAIAKWLGATGPGSGGGLDADQLDGQHGDYYRDLGKATGTLPVGNASGTYNIRISGNAATASTAGKLGGRVPSYYTAASNLTGRLPTARLTGSYNISISGNAATATNADKLDGQHGAYYRDLSKATGTLPVGNASGTYNISINGNAASASNAAKLGGKLPSHYTKADNLTGTAPRSVLPAATTTAAGTVERATNAEVETGADTTRYVTPAQISQIVTETKKALYPIGSIYANAVDGANPSTLLGFGTWARFSQGRVLVGLDDGDQQFGQAGQVGGEKAHTLTEFEMPRHAHEYARPPDDGNYVDGNSEDYVSILHAPVSFTTGYAGLDQPHNNLQPYIVVYMWRRTA